MRDCLIFLQLLYRQVALFYYIVSIEFSKSLLKSRTRYKVKIVRYNFTSVNFFSLTLLKQTISYGKD